MSVKGNSSIEEVSKSLKKKGVSVSNEALSVIIDTAFPELMEHVVKFNETVMKLGEDIAKLTELNASSNAELTKMQSSMEKLLAEEKLTDEEKKG